MSIDCVHLKKHYGTKIALAGVDLKIPDGGVTGLVGPNGAGKSTLIKLMTGLVWPSEGFVLVNGFDVHRNHSNAMRRMGAVIEWPSFHPDLSARMNLAILSGGHGRAYRDKLNEVTKFLNINGVLDRKVGVFSTGMKQRLGIALALLPDSDSIILDEPANGLDPAGIAEIRNLIRDYNRKFGVTVLLSSHLLSEIEQICDRVILLDGGMVKAQGTLEELLGKRHFLRIAVDRMDEAFAFLKNSFESHTLDLVSAPVMVSESILLEIKTEHPEAIGTALFRAGFAISHFAVERQNLEQFYLRNTNGGQS